MAELFGISGPKKELTVILMRHESASVDYRNRKEMVEYCYSLSDPLLSEKGITGAQATALDLLELLAGKGVAYVSSPMTRANETIRIIAPEGSPIIIDPLLVPADYNYVCPADIYEWMETENDATLYAKWAASRGFWYTWARVMALHRFLLQGGILHSTHKGEIVEVVVLVTHDEICRLLLCALEGVEPTRFAEDEFKVSRGEFVIIKISPKGKVEIERRKK